MRKPQGGVNTYVTAWALLACALAVATWGTVGWTPQAHLNQIGALALAVAAAEALHLRFTWGRTDTDFTFSEVAIVATLLVLPPTEAFAAIAVGAALTGLARRAAPIKILWNVSQIVVSAVAALAAIRLLPPVGPTVGGHGVIAALLGMTVYAAVNLTAMVGLFQRATGFEPRRILREHALGSTLAVLGNSTVGILFAHVWLTERGLLPLLLAPLVAMQLSYRENARARSLLTELTVEHDRLDRVVAGTSDGILLVDGEGRIELWNPALTELTGVSAEDAAGRPVAEVLHEGLRQGAPTAGPWLVEPELGSPTAFREVTLAPTGGSHRVVHESHTFLYDAEGRCRGVVALFHDVTRQHELARMKGDFISRVSHELRTPLTPIRGYADLLARRGEELTPGQRSEAAASIVERVVHMNALVEDLLLVARLEGGDAATLVEVAPAALDAPIERAVERARAAHGGRPITVVREGPTAVAFTDEDRIQQVVGNLLDNALRYSPPTSPVEVTVRGGDAVEVLVTDHGPGIPRDRQEEIFTRFHRLEDPLTMRTGGVGVGLYIARELTHAMGGQLTVRSEVGDGATFRVTLRPAAVREPQALRA